MKIASVKAALSDKEKGLSIDFLFLVLLVAFLPLFEAPKNIFFVLFVLAWLIKGFREKDWGGPWRWPDTLVSLWLLALAIVTLNVVLNYSWPMSGAKDPLRYLLIFWILSRCRYRADQVDLLLAVAVTFTLVALAQGYYELWLGKSVYLGLHSVGHVNHSAIYLMLISLVPLAYLLTRWRLLTGFVRALNIVSLAIILFSVFNTNSRAAVGAVSLIIVSSVLYVSLFINKKVGLILLLAIALLGVSFYINPPAVVEKHFAWQKAYQGKSDPREKVTNYFFLALEESPILGYGVDNAKYITGEMVKQWAKQRYGQYDPERYFRKSHPHNYYVNVIVSGGVVYAVAVGVFWLGCIIWGLLRVRDLRDDTLVLLALAGVVTSLVIGLVNTTIHHEHGILTMLMLGLAVSQMRPRGAG